jgi:hypothetical protein
MSPFLPELAKYLAHSTIHQNVTNMIEFRVIYSINL